MKIFRFSFLCIVMVFVFQAAFGQSSSQFRSALLDRADSIKKLKAIKMGLRGSIASNTAKLSPSASSTPNLEAEADKKKEIAGLEEEIDSKTEEASEKGNQDIQSKNFAGATWGAGLGVSFLNNSEIIRASLVGTTTRILEESRRNSGVVFEYHLLKPLTKSFRKRNIEVWKKAKDLTDKLDKLIKQDKKNLEDSVFSELKVVVISMDKEIVEHSFGVNPAECGLSLLASKISEFKETEIYIQSKNEEFKRTLESLEASIKYSYEVLSFSDVIVGCGPFAAIKTGGGDTFGINSMAVGVMFGLKSASLPDKCFNIGIGWSINNKVKRLAKNFDPNTETDLDKMFTQKDEKGWMLLISANVW